VSGALFANRAEFQRMMRDARAGAFDVLVFYDLDRFGRHARETMAKLYELTDLGVEIWDYSGTGKRVDVESFEGEMMTFMRARFAQQEREQGRKRTRDAMRRKAEQGYVTGGRTFGYNNVGPKGQTTRVPNDAEAAVVREIYQRYADGEGLRTIALSLNNRQAPCPRAQQGRPDGWTHISVRDVLQRPVYRGDVVWGRTTSVEGRELKKARPNTTRETGQIPQSEEHWIRREIPEQRLIGPELAARVDARFATWRKRTEPKTKGDRLPQRAHGKYLLTGGMLICKTCGGHFEAMKRPWKQDAVYVCSTRRRKPGVCTNTEELSVAEMDAAVLNCVEKHALGKTFINELLSLVDTSPDPTEHVQAERKRVSGQIDNLVKSVAQGMPADVIAPVVRDYQQQLAKLDGELRRPRAPRPDLAKLRAALEQRAADWRETLRGEPAVARVLLRRLVGPFEMADPNVVPAEFSEWVSSLTPALLDDLLQGQIVQLVASPTGFETVFWP
jgi:site-specific DNA recombinase